MGRKRPIDEEEEQRLHRAGRCSASLPARGPRGQVFVRGVVERL